MEISIHIRQENFKYHHKNDQQSMTYSRTIHAWQLHFSILGWYFKSEAIYKKIQAKPQLYFVYKSTDLPKSIHE